MIEPKLYQAAAGWLEPAIEALLRAGIQVVAPTEQDEGVVVLAPVSASDPLVLGNGNALLPLKRLFFPETEVILEYERRAADDVEVRPAPTPGGERVVLGSRPCDAAALDALDQVFQWDYDDVRYRAHRERTTVVSFACAAPAPHCFCTSVGGSPHNPAGSDVLAFLDGSGGGLVQALTDKGQAWVERLSAVLLPAQNGAQLPAAPALPARFDPAKVKAWLDANFESDFWREAAAKCLGCGACSYLCPTCHCFDLADEALWNRGQRRRNWDSCSFALFTLHASGHNPRPDQPARYRQRVMHKFKYFPERFGRLACVGCGRCLRACGVGQSLLHVLALIQERATSPP